MKIEIEFSNNTKNKIGESFLREVCERGVLSLEEKRIIGVKRFNLSVAIVSPVEIRKWNNEYRKKNEATDVLSFCYEKNNDIIEGEILLCLEEIEKNARYFGIETEEELAKNVIHGILHIVGFEHGEEMFELQDELLGESKSLLKK